MVPRCSQLSEVDRVEPLSRLYMLGHSRRRLLTSYSNKNFFFDFTGSLLLDSACLIPHPLFAFDFVFYPPTVLRFDFSMPMWEVLPSLPGYELARNSTSPGVDVPSSLFPHHPKHPRQLTESKCISPQGHCLSALFAEFIWEPGISRASSTRLLSFLARSFISLLFVLLCSIWRG